jgi:hypothetical protein
VKGGTGWVAGTVRVLHRRKVGCKRAWMVLEKGFDEVVGSRRVDEQSPSRRMAEGVPVEIAWFSRRSTGTGPGWRGGRVEALTRRGWGQ